MMIRISLFIFILAVVGCKQNPYSGPVANTPSPTYEPVKPELGIDVKTVLEFREGAMGRHQVLVKVPEGNPIVTWEGLPAEAVYNQAENELSWLPSYTDANDPKDFSVKSRRYLATIKLRSDILTTSETEQTVILEVTDTPRKFDMDFNTSYEVEVYEDGGARSIDFDLISEDFPTGPFNVSVKSSEPGLQIVADDNDPGKFSVSAGPFAPGTLRAGSLPCSSSWSCGLPVEGTVSAFAPDGRKAEGKVKFKVKDTRKSVVLSLPSKIDVRGDLALGFSALDPNEEEAPRVTVYKAPEVGKLEVSTSPELTSSEFESKYILSWSQIPPEAHGKTYTMQLRVCNSTFDTRLNFNKCENTTISLSVNDEVITYPEIARGNWSTNIIKYMLSARKYSHPININPGQGARLLSVKAVSSDSNDVTQVVANQSEILIQPKNPGIKFVTVTANNSLGGSVSETFMYEVLPTNWSSNVVLGFAGKNPELSMIESQLGDFNREFGMNHDARTLAERKSLFVGTESLSLPNGTEEVEFYGSNLKNIFVSTPKLANLPASIVNELRSHGVYLAKRASDVPGFNLKDFELTPSRDLGLPTGVTGLSGTTTSESTDPGLLSMTMSSDCSRLFGLFKPGATPVELLVGVSCTRSNGGRLVVLGFEWADIMVSQPDNHLPTQWFKRMMEK